MVGGLGGEIHNHLQLSGDGRLVKRSHADGYSHVHTIYSGMLLTQRWSVVTLLTNDHDCSPRSERKEWLEGSGWIDEVKRGTS